MFCLCIVMVQEFQKKVLWSLQTIFRFITTYDYEYKYSIHFKNFHKVFQWHSMIENSRDSNFN